MSGLSFTKRLGKKNEVFYGRDLFSERKINKHHRKITCVYFLAVEVINN